MADLISETATESISGGFVELSATRTYQVITTNRTDSFIVALADSGLPVLGTGIVFGTKILWCVSRNPTRVDTAGTGRKWNVACSFKNNTGRFQRDSQGNPVDDPVQAVKEVVISYQEFSEPITNATFRDITIGGPHNVGSVVGEPSWFARDTPGPIMVSTGEAVFAERPNYRKNVTVTKTFNDFDQTWDNYKNKLNSDAVTIIESDSQGTRATHSFAAFTLRMKPITYQEIWKDARMYFEARFEMEYNEKTWIHSELDVSQKRRVYVGGLNSDQTEIANASELTEKYNVTGSDFGFTNIVTKDEKGNYVAIGEPDRLNGFGDPIPYSRGDGNEYDDKLSFYLNYNKFESIEFDNLVKSWG